MKKFPIFSREKNPFNQPLKLLNFNNNKFNQFFLNKKSFPWT